MIVNPVKTPFKRCHEVVAQTFQILHLCQLTLKIALKNCQKTKIFLPFYKWVIFFELCNSLPSRSFSWRVLERSTDVSFDVEPGRLWGSSSGMVTGSQRCAKILFRIDHLRPQPMFPHQKSALLTRIVVITIPLLKKYEAGDARLVCLHTLALPLCVIEDPVPDNQQTGYDHEREQSCAEKCPGDEEFVVHVHHLTRALRPCPPRFRLL